MADLVILAPRFAANTVARPLTPIDAAWTVVAEQRGRGQDQPTIEFAPLGARPRLLTAPADQRTKHGTDRSPAWESSRFAAQRIAQECAADMGSSGALPRGAIAAYVRARDGHIQILGALEGLDLRA